MVKHKTKTNNYTTPLPITMNFFSLPKEIRLQLYSELLVLPEPIVFAAAYGPPSRPLFRSNRDGLCPALLQVNKHHWYPCGGHSRD